MTVLTERSRARQALGNHGYQPKNNVEEANNEENDHRDRVIGLDLVVPQKAANLAISRQREPESRAGCDKKDHTNKEFHWTTF
jgi:hypothetical protein